MGQRKNLHKASVSKTETLFHFGFLVQVNHTKENLLKFQTNTIVFEKAADSGDEKFNSYIEGLKEQTSQHISQQTEKTIEK